MVRNAQPLLIRNADVWGVGMGDVLMLEGRIVDIGGNLSLPETGTVVDASGGALLPGLHDHHIHLAGEAVRGLSVFCGPPDVTTPDRLAEVLCNAPGSGWIRAIGYHESVLGGLPTARDLDRFVANRPLRMQHRSGRMWLLNSAALEALLALGTPPPGLERDGTGFTGHLFDEDDWLRAVLGSTPPDLAALSARLAACGITGVTDMSPHNGPEMARHFAREASRGALVQRCVLAGTPELADADKDGWTLGPVKLHLHEADLPPFDDAVHLIASAHDQDRGVAIHCVSEVELVFALAALDQAGRHAGDRIEHASVTPPPQLAQIAEMGLSVCTQPHFLTERGDQYLTDVEPHLLGDLYRLKSFAIAGLPLAGGSDAPFGSSDPWAAMRAAVSRTTRSGNVLGKDEALSSEEALELYLASPHDLWRQRAITPGTPADLCLLDRPWNEARHRLNANDVAATIVSGRIVHDRIDQPPVERPAR